MSPTLEEVQKSADAQRHLALTLFRTAPQGEWITLVSEFVEGGSTNIGRSRVVRTHFVDGQCQGRGRRLRSVVRRSRRDGRR
jgi:hypothetical protein